MDTYIAKLETQEQEARDLVRSRIETIVKYALSDLTNDNKVVTGLLSGTNRFLLVSMKDLEAQVQTKYSLTESIEACLDQVKSSRVQLKLVDQQSVCNGSCTSTCTCEPGIYRLHDSNW